jgi:tRNA G10  N-methylase Trm11
MSYYLNKRRAIKLGEATPDAKKPKLIAKQSDKRKIEQKEYVEIVKKLLKINPNCEINQFGCTGKAQGLHHKQKRTPSNFKTESNLLRACNSCNLWVEMHPLEAIKKGFSISKHIKK